MVELGVNDVIFGGWMAVVLVVEAAAYGCGADLGIFKIGQAWLLAGVGWGG